MTLANIPQYSPYARLVSLEVNTQFELVFKWSFRKADAVVSIKRAFFVHTYIQYILFCFKIQNRIITGRSCLRPHSPRGDIGSKSSHVFRSWTVHLSIRHLYVLWYYFDKKTFWFVWRKTRRSSALGQQTASEQQEKPELQGEFGHDRAKDLTNGECTVQVQFSTEKMQGNSKGVLGCPWLPTPLL